MKRKAAFHTLGCKLNFAETSSIGRQLKQEGFSIVGFEQEADIYLINTCSVTENADRECRKIVRDALRINPDGFIVMIGCYAQLKPDEIAAIPGVDLVLGASEKFNITRLLSDQTKSGSAKVHSCEINEVNLFQSSFSVGDRTRSFLKVQDGCDFPCAYCTIPLARGKSRSNSIEGVVKEANEIAASGVKEIVLTGVNTGDFGIIAGERRSTILELIKALDEMTGIERFRISSIEPNLLTDEIISFVASSKRFVPHFHIPLQSGSDKILGLMKRRYSKHLYGSRVRRIKELMPECCIGADVITGFPAESEQDFLETLDLLKDLDVSYLHVFTYSERDNTEALQITPVIPVEERKRRNKMLRILSEKKQRIFYESCMGQIRPVLFESDPGDGYIYGFTDNYIRVREKFDPELINKIIDIELSLNSEGIIESTQVANEINT